MPDPLEDIFKMCGSVGTAVTSGWAAIGKIRKRFTQIQDITDQGGKQDALFALTYTVFQYIYGVSLIVCGLASFCLLVGGVAKVVSPPEGMPYLTAFFEDSTVQILVLAILVFVVALLNVLSWVAIVLLGWIPTWVLPIKQSSSWYNLWQFSLPLSEPKPIFLNPDAVSNVADLAILKLKAQPATSRNFAGTPTHLSLDERANAALLGCLFEKEHGVRRWPKPNWDAFYAAVAAAEVNSIKLVSPAYLIGLNPNSDFYTTFTGEVNRRLPEGEPRIPDSAEARRDLSNAIKILVKKYHGSARNLAFRWWSREPKLRLAFSRSQAFSPFDVSGMIPQFLKLAVRWETWPNVKPGNFIYPYARNLALLLFEKGAMVTLPNVKNLSFKQTGQLAAYRDTMRRIVQRARENLGGSNKPEHRQIIASYTTEWQLAAAVDFALWAYSVDLIKQNGFKQWKLDKNGLVTRKGEVQEAKAENEDEVTLPEEG